jgi:HlyD family secretion protein
MLPPTDSGSSESPVGAPDTPASGAAPVEPLPQGAVAQGAVSQQGPVSQEAAAQGSAGGLKGFLRSFLRLVGRIFLWTAILLLVFGLAAAGLYWWRLQQAGALPAYIVETNGRLEMARIDIAVKYPGRVVGLFIREGDVVRPGEIVAQQEDAEIKAQIAGAEAERARAQDAIGRANAELDARRNSEQLARLEWTQTKGMHAKKLVSDVELERRRIGLDAESAGVAAAASAVSEAKAAVGAANAQIARLEVVLGEATIRAPTGGRIEYRMIEKDAVLPAGGRIATMLNTDDVYMTVFISADAAGRLKLGDEARIQLGAFGAQVLPATISFVSPEAQFTPKYVETASEREKLVYRVKLQIPVAVARQFSGQLKAGATGEGYVRLDPSAPWPERLSVKSISGTAR